MVKARAQMSVTTYEQAVAKLGDKHERVTIGHNTTIESDWHQDDTTAERVNERVVTVRLHGHAIVRLYEDGVAVRDCGYVTALTYQRINQFLPAGYQANIKDFAGRITNRRTGGYEAVSDDAWLWVEDVV
jgi:hypothetical protein